MSRSSQLARSLYGSVQHALASRQALAGAAQAGLGLLDQPSTSGSTYSSASSIGSYGLVAGSLGIQHLPHSAGQYRQISFWRRSPQPPATQEAHDFGTDGVVGTSTLAAPVDLPVEPAGFFPLQEDSLEVFSAIQSACNALDKASILAAKADTWFLPSWFISALETAHSSLGTPWWISIMLFNITLRTCTLPLMVFMQKISAGMMKMNHDLVHAKKLQEASMKAKSPEEQARLFRAFQEEYTRVTAKHGGFSKFAGMPAIMIVNMGLFISLFTAVQKLTAAKLPSLTTGGAFTFTDLTVPDPYFVLPAFCTIVTLLNIEYGLALNADVGMPEDRRMMTQRMKMLFRIFAFAFIPFGSFVPAGTATLWVSNTAFGTVQGLLLRDPRFRRRVGLPTMEEMKAMNLHVQEANKNSSAQQAATAAPPPPAPTALYSNSPRPARR